MDGPVGTGFSYSETLDGYIMDDYKFVAQAYEFLQKVCEKVDSNSIIFLVKNCICFFKLYPLVEAFKTLNLSNLIPNFMQWLTEHPQYQENQLYVGGDSYSGIPIPMIVQQIVIGNICRWGPKLN